MTDQPEDRLGRDTRRVTLYIKIAELVLLIVITVAVVFACIAIRNANNAAGQGSAKFQQFADKGTAILAKIEEKADALDVKGVNDVIRKGGETFDGLKPVERAAANTIGTVGRETASTMQSARAQIATVGPAIDEVHHQIKQNGDAAHDLITASTTLANKFGVTADEAATVLQQLSANLGVSMDALVKRINDHRLDDVLESAAKAANEADLTLIDFHKDLHDTMAEMPGIAKDVHKTSTNIAKFSKVSIIVSILSRFMSALIPGLLN